MVMSATSEKTSVLLVEDNYDQVTELASSLMSHGIEVVGPAPTVEDALTYVRSSPCLSAAILDINLDGEKVFPVADELSRRNVPFFFASGYSREIVPQRFADRIFVQKPLNMSAVRLALSDCRSLEMNLDAAAKNLILTGLSPREAKALQPHLKQVHLIQGQSLENQFEEVRFVYFIEAGIVSLVARSGDGLQLEAGLIGREGMTGTGLLEGDWRSPYQLDVQVEGTAQRIAVDSLLRLMPKAPQLRSRSTSFSRSLGIQISYTALAGGRYSIQQRMARWLLMLSDRAETSLLSVTHNQIAAMLGVRRSGITDALHLLEGENLIRSTRGKVRVVDRSGLIRKACGSYGIPEAEYERLMGFGFAAKAPTTAPAICF